MTTTTDGGGLVAGGAFGGRPRFFAGDFTTIRLIGTSSSESARNFPLGPGLAAASMMPRIAPCTDFAMPLAAAPKPPSPPFARFSAAGPDAFGGLPRFFPDVGGVATIFSFAFAFSVDAGCTGAAGVTLADISFTNFPYPHSAKVPLAARAWHDSCSVRLASATALFFAPFATTVTQLSVRLPASPRPIFALSTRTVIVCISSSIDFAPAPTFEATRGPSAVTSTDFLILCVLTLNPALARTASAALTSSATSGALRSQRPGLLPSLLATTRTDTAPFASCVGSVSVASSWSGRKEIFSSDALASFSDSCGT